MGARVERWGGVIPLTRWVPKPASLVERAQAGDLAAFEALYREHVGRIHALCRRLTGGGYEAEERTQDVFVRAFERLDSFRGDAAFGTWLHRLAVNVVLEERRTRERRVGALLVDGAPESAEAPRDRGLGMDLERAIAGLPEGARIVFVLYEIEGYQHEEIAALLDVSAGTSKAQLHRAKKLLREVLER